MDGVLIINKPAGMTSHDVVAHVRRITSEKSVGHLGTLDPMATGVLPLVLGRFTRLAQFYSDADKRYEGLIRFGRATDTYDAEGSPIGPERPVGFGLDELRAAAKAFTGNIEQLPPPFSAKKIAGVPAYRLARKGQPVELKPKQVQVKELEIISFDGKNAQFKAWVSSGTYLRSLAHDLGQRLGVGAHLAELMRTAVREFTIEDAHSLGINQIDTQRLITDIMLNIQETVADSLLHPRLVLPEFPAVTASPESVSKIRHGGAVNLPEFSKAPIVRVFAGQRELLAIARRVAGTLFHPKVVLQG
ncbi:MAG TPA: tRNA pseudouridine(55) synthase TruB [Candidatus Angelobacter sp.]|nr:tRNA pseudouridine(55) synthase TruB [Candidatus Angelobacter sp.]